MSIIRKQISLNAFRKSISLTPLGTTTSKSQNLEIHCVANPVVDLTRYEFQFERIMLDSEVYQVFRDFLQKACSMDELLFVEAVNLMEYSDDNAQRKMSVHIFNRFVERDAENEINLSNEIRNKIENHFQSEDASDSDDDSENKLQVAFDDTIFSEAKFAVLNLIRDNHFPLFVKSNLFQEFMKRKPLHYVEKLAITKERKSITIQITDARVQEREVYVLDPTLPPHISDKDIVFIMQSANRMNDADYCKSVGDCFFSRKTIDLGHSLTSQMVMIVWKTQMPYNMKEIKHALFDKSSASFEKIVPVSLVYATDPDTSSVAVTRKTVLYSTTGLSNREYCLANTAVSDPDGNCIVIVNKSCSHSTVGKAKDGKRAYSIGGQIFKQEANGTSCTEVLFLSVNRWVSRKLFKRAYKTRATEIHKEIVQRIERSRLLGFPAPSSTDGLWLTLLDNEKRQAEKSSNGGCSWMHLNNHVQFV